MMRLPPFRYLAPRTVARGGAHPRRRGPGRALLLAGGTDLFPNMKRRQQTPRALVALRGVAELRERAANGARRCALGAGTDADRARARRRALRASATRRSWQAAAQVATPHLRNMGTLGGNLCLDTRCNYYDQNYEWRKAIDFCMKKDGEICWVAPASPTLPGGLVDRHRAGAHGARRARARSCRARASARSRSTSSTATTASTT